MRAFLPPFLTILLSLAILGLVGYDFWLLPMTTDLGDVSYAIHSPERITIDGQWGHVLCMMMAMGIVALQVVQLLRKGVRTTPGSSK